MTAAAARDRPLHDRRAARRAMGDCSATRSTTCVLPALVLARVQRRPADALHALGGARGARQRLRPRGARQGAAGADRVVRYILRAALPSVVTVLGLAFANVLTGAVLVEKIFSWPGIGQYAYNAASTSTCRRSWASASSSRSSTSPINFVVDVLYGVIDPRIRDHVTRPGRDRALGTGSASRRRPGGPARRRGGSRSRSSAP